MLETEDAAEAPESGLSDGDFDAIPRGGSARGHQPERRREARRDSGEVERARRGFDQRVILAGRVRAGGPGVERREGDDAAAAVRALQSLEA